MPAELTAVASQYDLPNYIGEVFFQKSERPNTFLKLVGGLSGGVRLLDHVEFAMGVDYVLPVQTQPAILEGATPGLKMEQTEQVTNLTQIFQESVSLTYTRESSTAAIGGLAVIPGGAAGDLIRPGSFDWQVARAIERIQMQMNVSFLAGAYQKPVDNTTARKTRGVRTAMTTNVFDKAAAALTKAMIESDLQTMMVNRAFNRGDEIYVLAGAAALDKLVSLYEGTPGIFQPASRTVAGLQLYTLVSRWATLQVMWEPDVANGEILYLQPSKIRTCAMPITAGGQNKGILFREELAHTGAARIEQVYGEWGIDYTNEIFHGVTKNFT